MKSQRSQQGLYLVEFALVGALFMFILFGAFEVARLMFTWSALDAITQRGARVAAVCPLNDPIIGEIAIFGTPGETSTPFVQDIDDGNISIGYFDVDGVPTANYDDVFYVQVGITNYTHQMLIPELIVGFVNPSILSPTFSTIRPAESMGYDPGNPIRSCFV